MQILSDNTEITGIEISVQSNCLVNMLSMLIFFPLYVLLSDNRDITICTCKDCIELKMCVYSEFGCNKICA